MTLDQRLVAVFTVIGNVVKNKLNRSEKGQPNGVATLDNDGKVPASQLPSYVDDILEYANYAALPGTGEGGKIYVVLDVDEHYRWSGSAYTKISKGEVSKTEFDSLKDNVGNTDTDFVNTFTTALDA